jgi:hypothetical protein
MVEFDKPRCVRIISDTITSIDATMADHTDVVDYVSHKEMLASHAELELDKQAMTGLKEHLQNDHH